MFWDTEIARKLASWVARLDNYLWVKCWGSRRKGHHP